MLNKAAVQIKRLRAEALACLHLARYTRSIVERRRLRRQVAQLAWVVEQADRKLQR
jgi:hypothetical protein